MLSSNLDVQLVAAFSLSFPRRRGKARIGVIRSRISFYTVMLSCLLITALSAAQSDPIRVLYYPPCNISKLPMYMARDAGIF